MSAYNSTVAFDCIATDPGSTTIYGITRVWHDNVMSIMLVKSIVNPSHISGNMWTIVSETIDAPLSYWGVENNPRPFKFVDCAASSKGAFSAFFRNGQYLTPGSVTVPIGVRYDPESQTWSSIKTSPYYGWTSDLWVHKSFYVNKDGVESAVHALTDYEGTVIRFGVVNEVKNVLQLAGVWKKAQFETIDSYPFTDPTAPPPPKEQVFKGPDKFVSHYLFSGTRGGSTYLGGIRWSNSNETKEYKTYTISNLNGVMQPGPVYAAPFYDYRTKYTSTSKYNDTLETHDVNVNFVGVGGHLDGQDPFVIGLTSKGVYEFAINSKNNSNPIGVMEVEKGTVISVRQPHDMGVNPRRFDARGRRITQQFAMGTLTHRTGHASGVDGRSRRTRIGAVATPTRLHPSITNADIVAYENAVLNNAESSSDPPPVFVSSPDEESGESHPAAIAAAAADLLPPLPPTYEDDGRAPEYSRHPQQPEVVIPISRA
ncbi:MAG: hypothetical protein J3R72DRAFT_475316 [Linnemannia gamsii]|nr:MAG: hypothetical protein J3R72DRAFT_475316 [Linnemannia gamsii]